MTNFLLLKETEILNPLREYLNQIRSILAGKVSRIRELIDEIGVGANVHSLSNQWAELSPKSPFCPYYSVSTSPSPFPSQSQSQSESKSCHESNKNFETNTNTNSDLNSNSNSNSNLDLNNKDIETNTNTANLGSTSEEKNRDKDIKCDLTGTVILSEAVDDENYSKYDKNTKINENYRINKKKEGKDKLFELFLALFYSLKPLYNGRVNLLLDEKQNSDYLSKTNIRYYIRNKIEKNLNINSENNEERKSANFLYGGHSNDTDNYFEKMNKNENNNNNNDNDSNDNNNDDKKKTEKKNLENNENDKKIKIATENEKISNLSELLENKLWGVCGFSVQDPLQDFHSNGLLALKNLTEFLLRFENAGCLIGFEFAQSRYRYCTYSQVAVQLSKLTADVLHLTPTPYTPIAAPIQYLAKQSSWQLLSEHNAFQEMFNLSILTFDEVWRSFTGDIGSLPNENTYEHCLMHVQDILETLINQVD